VGFFILEYQFFENADPIRSPTHLTEKYPVFLRTVASVQCSAFPCLARKVYMPDSAIGLRSSWRVKVI